jgi:hypothetical protein
MGQSTNGQICYGAIFEEGNEFPWDERGSLEEWWRTESGIDEAKTYPAEGWREYEQAFDAAHPCPVEEVNYCSGDYPIYMLAIPATLKKCRRGYPEKFEPSELVVSLEDFKAFTDFCGKYNLISEHPVGWYLTSYWG